MHAVNHSSRCRHAAAAALLLCMAPTAAAQDDWDDILGGFEDMGEYADVIESEDPAQRTPTRRWGLSGNLAAAASYNLRDHRSTTGTDYSGLSKFRLRGLLELKTRLSGSWNAELKLGGWRDLAYTWRNADYTPEVLDAYESELEVLDAWVAGKLLPTTDLKLGRQIAVWGFSDSLRVLDVLNPLDNLEPGLADIEDLRRPVGMLRLDHYTGPWRLSAFVTPEQRFSRNPPFGSDFYSVTDAQGNATRFREERPDDFESIDYAASLYGSFSGWDLSLNVARQWFDEPYLDLSDFDRSNPNATPEDFANAAVLRHSRITLVGFGTQLTRGGWLFKQEAARIDGLELTRSTPLEPAPPGAEGQFLPQDARAVQRYDMLLGAEYFGMADTTFSVELAARYIDDFGEDLARSGYQKWRSESAFRMTRDFMNQRLRLLLVSVLFSRDGQFWTSSGGAIHRASAEYELTDSLRLTGGIAVYESGQREPFNIAGRNDRLFGEIRWSF
jgi:hypothetical protein